MVCKAQLNLIAAVVLGGLALCAFTSTTSTKPRIPLASNVDQIESVARTQQRFLNDRARVSRGDTAAPSRWFEPAAESAQ